MLLVKDNAGDAELIQEVFSNYPANTQMHVLNNEKEALQFLQLKDVY